jgi:hypothetical protein
MIINGGKEGLETTKASSADGLEWRYSSTYSLTLALDGGEWSASHPGRFIPWGGRTPRTHWIGGWVGPRAGLDAVAKRKIRDPCRESKPNRADRTSYVLFCMNSCDIHISYNFVTLLWIHCVHFLTATSFNFVTLLWIHCVHFLTAISFNYSILCVLLTAGCLLWTMHLPVFFSFFRVFSARELHWVAFVFLLCSHLWQSNHWSQLSTHCCLIKTRIRHLITG